MSVYIIIFISSHYMRDYGFKYEDNIIEKRGEITEILNITMLKYDKE